MAAIATATTLPTFYDITVIQTSQRAPEAGERDGNRPLEREGASETRLV